ncbi:MAG: acyl carrier protein phosphodiesterase [Cryomorphaceae bacterium]|jgi:acyl carrier protein phosphodiesterase
MNYLAHLSLIPSIGEDRADALRIGNLLGDFIKGTESSLRLEHPTDLVDGIMLHRAIDKFTDAHPAFLASKKLLAPERRRYAGIVVDIIYDHFLSLHWGTYHEKPLEQFISNIYNSLDENKEWQLGAMKQAFPIMKSQNWLASYATKEGIHETFRRVATRGKFTARIADTHLDFNEHYHSFENHFHLIYKDLLEFTNQFTFEPPSLNR